MSIQVENLISEMFIYCIAMKFEHKIEDTIMNNFDEDVMMIK